jgi:hypothetical protein
MGFLDPCDEVRVRHSKGSGLNGLGVDQAENLTGIGGAKAGGQQCRTRLLGVIVVVCRSRVKLDGALEINPGIIKQAHRFTAPVSSSYWTNSRP